PPSSTASGVATYIEPVCTAPVRPVAIGREGLMQPPANPPSTRARRRSQRPSAGDRDVEPEPRARAGVNERTGDAPFVPQWADDPAGAGAVSSYPHGKRAGKRREIVLGSGGRGDPRLEGEVFLPQTHPCG